jgi:hypothetical protein
LQRITENLEDSLGSVRLGEVAGRGVDAAGRLMAGLVAAGRTVAGEIAGEPPRAERPGNGAPDSAADAPAEPPATPPRPAPESQPPPA